MRVGSITLVGVEVDFLPGCLEGLQDLSRRIVLQDKYDFQGNPIKREGNLDIQKICRQYNAELVHLDTLIGDQASQRNSGLEMLSGDVDWALSIDLDEYMTRRSLRRLLEFEDNDSCPTWRIKPINIFRYGNARVEETQNAGKIMLMKPDKVRYTSRGEVNSDTRYRDEVEYYHFSYVRTPAQMKKKLVGFSHADEVRDGFYDFWLNADENTKNLHPTSPNLWPKMEKIHLPDEIKYRLPTWVEYL